MLVFDGAAPFELGVVCEVFAMPRPELDVAWWYTCAVCTEAPGQLSALGGFTLGVERGLDAVAEADTLIVPAAPDVHADPADAQDAEPEQHVEQQHPARPAHGAPARTWPTSTEARRDRHRPHPSPHVAGLRHQAYARCRLLPDVPTARQRQGGDMPPHAPGPGFGDAAGQHAEWAAHGGPFPFFGGLMFLLFLLLVGATLFYLRRSGRIGELGRARRPKTPEHEAREILATRFATGDISSDEFLERASVLNWTPGVEPLPVPRKRR